MNGRVCPVLTTARLTLGPHTAADYDDSLAMWSDLAVVRYLGGEASPPQEVWARLLRYGGLWPIVGYGYWQVRETATGRFVGEVGLAEFRRDISPSIIGVPEAGWSLMTWAHGQGLAREATQAMLDWADTVLPDRRSVCMIDPHNAPSLALANRLGYRSYAESRYKGRDTVLLERHAP